MLGSNILFDATLNEIPFVQQPDFNKPTDLRYERREERCLEVKIQKDLVNNYDVKLDLEHLFAGNSLTEKPILICISLLSAVRAG